MYLFFAVWVEDTHESGGMWLAVGCECQKWEECDWLWVLNGCKIYITDMAILCFFFLIPRRIVTFLQNIAFGAHKFIQNYPIHFGYSIDSFRITIQRIPILPHGVNAVRVLLENHLTDEVTFLAARRCVSQLAVSATIVRPCTFLRLLWFSFPTRRVTTLQLLADYSYHNIRQFSVISKWLRWVELPITTINTHWPYCQKIATHRQTREARKRTGGVFHFGCEIAALLHSTRRRPT